MLNLFWTIILFPLAGAFLNGVLGKRLAARWVAWVSCSTVGLSLLVSAACLWELVSLPPEQRTVSRSLFTWIESGDFAARFSFLLDPLSMVMILIVTGVGLIIHVYSVGYMAGDPGFYRYFSYLNLFIFMMSVLVLADNYVLMFVGWEGVGLCSYLLIGYYFDRRSAGDAAKKAFVVNRIGDVGFVLGIFLMFHTFGTVDYLSVFEAAARRFPSPEGGFGVVSAICLLLFLGATGKSAQIPLYVWLPDAMEGPTPVSALIHAATMVTAGVYMVARSAALFARAPEVLWTVALIGIATAVLAAAIAVVQTDIKRVLAYSTISQLGYMFLALGVGAFGAGIFHLMTHAFFKALLFLGSGSVILALHHEQDLLRMGGLKKYLPITTYTMWIGTLAIAGLPLFAGFFSKDQILWKVFAGGHAALFAVGVAVAALTSFYMARLMFLVFHGPLSAAETSPSHRRAPHEPSALITVPLVILALFSAFAGLLGLPEYLGSNRLETFLEPTFQRVGQGETGTSSIHGMPWELGVTLTAVFIAVAGIWVAYRAYIVDRQWPVRLASRVAWLYRAARGKFFVDEAYDRLLVHPISRWSRAALWTAIDDGVVDRLVNGTASFMQQWGRLLRYMHSGYVRLYAAWILGGAVLILLYYYWSHWTTI